MSRKKTIITNYFLFVNNINRLVDDNGGKYAFADAIGVSYDAVRQWCNGENLPDGARMLAIQAKFNVSIDWLLNGKEPIPVKYPQPGQISQEEFIEGYIADWPEEDKKACRRFRKIMASNDPVVKFALLSNLAAFEESLEQKEEVRRLNRRLQFLEDRQQAEQDAGIDVAASSSTGNGKT